MLFLFLYGLTVLSASLLSRYLPSPDRMPDQLTTLSMLWGWLLLLVLLQVLHHLLVALTHEARAIEQTNLDLGI